MKTIEYNEEGGLDIPLNTEINLITNKWVDDNDKFKGFKYMKFEIKFIDNSIELIYDDNNKIRITGQELLDSDEAFYVSPKDINDLNNIQALSYDENGFTSNGINYYY